MPRLFAAFAALLLMLPTATRAQDSILSDLLTESRSEAGLVGMGAGVMVNGEIVATATAGERIKGSDEPIPEDALWHLGSITKSMTATLIATMVEKETISFETTVGDVFGSGIDESWQGVTLSQLLTHRSGAPANFPLTMMLPASPRGHWAVSVKRQENVLKLLENPIPGETGEFVYSNAGYTIAGAMAERVSGGTPWELLLDDWVMTPLGIKVTYGPPQDETAPWGHAKGVFGKSPKDPEKRADNPAFIGPAGTVALSLEDMLKYGQAHLSQDPTLLSRASYDHLRTPPVRDETTGEGYAFGWVVDPSGNSLGAGPIIWHNGSNTFWYALLILIPEQDAVIAVTVNDGDLKSAEPAAWKLARKIADDFSLTP